eukprot:6093394-Pleurochrysis_carterae.AAC.1
MLRSCNMTGQHAQLGGGYVREGYAKSIYAPAAGECAFNCNVPCNLPGRDNVSELPKLLWRRPTTGLDVADVLSEARRRVYSRASTTTSSGGAAPAALPPDVGPPFPNPPPCPPGSVSGSDSA